MLKNVKINIGGNMFYRGYDINFDERNKKVIYFIKGEKDQYTLGYSNCPDAKREDVESMIMDDIDLIETKKRKAI